MKHLVDIEPAKRRPKDEAPTHGASLQGNGANMCLNRLPCGYWSTGGKHPYKAEESFGQRTPGNTAIRPLPARTPPRVSPTAPVFQCINAVIDITYWLPIP